MGGYPRRFQNPSDLVCFYTTPYKIRDSIQSYYLHVSGLWQLCPWRKYWGFSMTGMRVMPMTTVSGPASSDEGVVMPWLMWCSGLAESSSPLMTATGPAQTMRDKGLGEVTSTFFKTSPALRTFTALPHLLQKDPVHSISIAQIP